MNTANSLLIIGAAVLFILGIRLLSSPKTARYGNLVAAAGMLVALVSLHGPDGHFIWTRGWDLNYALIIIGILIGLAAGAAGAYSVKMTSMPQMVALFNGLGGGAAALVAGLEFVKGLHMPLAPPWFIASFMLFASLIGSLSFSGSIIAYLKLEGKLEKPLTFPGQNLVNSLILYVRV